MGKRVCMHDGWACMNEGQVVILCSVPRDHIQSLNVYSNTIMGYLAMMIYHDR